MDLVMDYGIARRLGPDRLLAVLQRQYPGFRLYWISGAWMSDRQYIAKARGLCGDVICEWS